MSPHCDLDSEDSNSTFSNNTLAHIDASVYQDGSQKGTENMVPDSGQTFTETLSLTCYCAHDFEQSNPASRQNPDRHMDRIPIYPHFTTGWEI